MSSTTRTILLHYGGALAFTALAVLLRWLLDPWLGDDLPFSTLFGSVALAVWVGGYRPALLAVALGFLACEWLFVEPRGTPGLDNARNLIGFLAYLLSCGIIVGFGEALRVARRRADQQREALRVTLASMGDAVITTDAAGRVASSNPVAVALTGWTQDEAAGRPLEEVFHVINEQSRQPVENPVKTVLVRGRVVGLANHTTLIAKDGTGRPIDDSAAPIKDAQGRVLGVVLVFRDVTERRRAERSARLLASIVESSDDAIIGKDVNGVITSWNQGAERIFGYTAAEAVGCPIGMLAPPDRADEMPGILERIRRGERVEHFDTVRRAKGGRLVPVSLTVSPIRDRDGSILGASKIARDVAERKRAEGALREEKERLSLLWEAASVLLTTTEPDAMLRELFAKIGPHFGLDTYFNYMVNETGDALRLVSSIGIPDETAEQITRLEFGQAICGTVALQRQPVVATHVQQSDDPKAQPVKSFGIRACACNPLQSNNDLLGTLSFASRSRDQFDEDELEFLRIICRYVAVAYERLRLVRQLRNADRRKDEFLATLAHELRNPLAPLRNAVELLRRSEGDAAVSEQARSMMGRQLDQMVRLIDDLLDVSRISQGKVRLRKERVELKAVVGSALEAVQPLLQAQGHELTVTLPPAAIYLDADSTRLAQVISNLLSNAAKYTERGGHIWLTAERQGNEAVVSVRDTGIGIAAEHLPHLFEMFSQVAPALERSQGGLGIGLSLVRGLVELHGGRVEARSGGIGRGSEFIVRLPVVDVPVPDEPQQPAEDNEVASGRKRRILAVDDNRDAADSLAMMLQMMGHETRTAYDGLEAVQAAAAFRPDVVLLDIGLPKMNGYEVARQIRQQRWGEGMALIALTGWGQEEDRRRALEAGFDHHLTKPVEAAALEKLLALISPAQRQ